MCRRFYQMRSHGQKEFNGQEFKTEYELESEISGRDALPCVRKWDADGGSYDLRNHPHSDVVTL